MEKPETESKYEEDKREKLGTSRQEKFFRFIFASSVLLASTHCSGPTPTEVGASGIDDRFPQGKLYIPREEELHSSDHSVSPEGSYSLPSEVSLSPDSKEFVSPSGIVVPKEEVEEEVIAKQVGENSFSEIENILSSETKEILSLQPELSFDEGGELYFKGEDNKENQVLTIKKRRDLEYPYDPLDDAKFFVIHYDGAPQILPSGEYRTVLNTMNGLDREGNPSVHFCVDSFPVNNEFVGNKGVGVILSQATGPMPSKGGHVLIGIELATGREDINRVKTADLYEQVGVGQDFVDFIRSGNKDFNSFSLGMEQVGTGFSINFPEQFPPKQQIANVLALVKAASERYGLSAWDIVGHHEIQEKSDPGDEYMLTLRYLLGLSYLLDEQLPDDFLETDNPYDYFVKLKNYSIARMGEDRYSNWNEIYGLDGVIKWFENIER